mgnify:FL=1
MNSQYFNGFKLLTVSKNKTPGSLRVYVDSIIKSHNSLALIVSYTTNGYPFYSHNWKFPSHYSLYFSKSVSGNLSYQSKSSYTAWINLSVIKTERLNLDNIFGRCFAIINSLTSGDVQSKTPSIAPLRIFFFSNYLYLSLRGLLLPSVII